VTGVLTAYLFDDRVGEEVGDWEGAARALSEDQVLWVDLTGPSDEDGRRVRDAFSLRDEDPRRLDPSTTRPELTQHESYIRVTSIAVRDVQEPEESVAVVLECFVGVGWVVTVHADELEVIEDFRDIASGSGELGALDAASFLATLLEWVITSYTRAFAAIELTLERFDTQVLQNPARDVEPEVSLLVATRQRVGLLRRRLEPHRELFAALGHAEFDLVSTETSAQRFGHLEQRVDRALTSARDVKESVVNSFDMLILRTEHRTNEIVKVLTLTSILLLPGALLAGLMGMNVNLGASDFVSSSLFWGVVVVMLVIGATTLVLARLRHWI
jgi:magnesium transporter